MRRFAEDGYDDVGLRDIGADVGVDPALIVRYFGSKEGLFRAAIEHCHEGSDLLDGDRDSFGRRIAHEIVHATKSPEKMWMLKMILRSMSSARAMEVVRQSSMERFMTPFAEWIGAPRAMVRARLAACVMMGMSVGKEITGGLDMDADDKAYLEAQLARMLQDIVDGA